MHRGRILLFLEGIVRNHKPVLLVLLETKMTDHKNITDILNFDSFIQSPAEGLSGGIVIMWNEDVVKLDNISVTTQGIHAKIKVTPHKFLGSLLPYMLALTSRNISFFGKTCLTGPNCVLVSGW